MELRPYQQAAREAVENRWEQGDDSTLLSIPTGCGKTVIFAKIAEDRVRQGDRVLILAHRGELLDQAADKLHTATGLSCATEKAEQSCLGSWLRVAVGSVQTLMRPKRLAAFPRDYFGTIIIDEAHHAVSDSYGRILNHFDSAKVLGVTATPDRGDMRNLGSVFQSLAYEYSLTKAIREGYLVPIKALTVPLKMDLTGVGVQSGDFKPGDLDSALDPYLYQIAGKAAKLLDRLAARRTEGLTTPKQIRFLEGKGFTHVGTWQFEQAKQLIDRIAANGWRIPRGIDPKTYMG